MALDRDSVIDSALPGRISGAKAAPAQAIDEMALIQRVARIGSWTWNLRTGELSWVVK